MVDTSSSADACDGMALFAVQINRRLLSFYDQLAQRLPLDAALYGSERMGSCREEAAIEVCLSVAEGNIPHLLGRSL